jgi:hypothetical protein
VDGRARLPVGQPLERGEQAGRVVGQVVRVAAVGHGLAALQQGGDVDPHQGGGQQAHGGQHTEPAAHAGGDGKGGDGLPRGDLPEHPLLRVGGEQEVAAVAIRIVVGPGQPLPDHQELGHGLRRRAGLADDVEQCAPHVDPVQEPGHRGWVHVVEYVQAGIMVARLGVPLVPVGTPQGMEQGGRPQGGASDPQDDHVLERLARPVGEGLDLGGEVGGLEEVVEAESPRGPPGRHLGMDLREPCAQLGEAVRLHAAPTEAGRHHVSVIEL